MTLAFTIITVILILIGIQLIARVSYYAWNMPEAYIPARFSSLFFFVAGMTFMITIEILRKGP